MKRVDEIKKFKTYVVDERNSQRVTEQRLDQEFFEDKYPMPMIVNVKYQIRTGYVAGMINGVANQMIGKNPRCFTKSRSDADLIKKASDRIAIEGNRQLKVWLRTLQNPYRKTFKTNILRGEEWIYMVHDENLDQWKESEHDGLTWQKYNPDFLPVIPIFYDPMVMFHDPSEDVNGQPSRVVVFFQRNTNDLIQRYPKWRGKENLKVDFFLYFDDEYSYAEAEGKPLFGLRKNLYKRVPFVHCYTGWGVETEDKDPALLAFSRPRMLRNLITEASTMHSNIALSAHKEAHGTRLIIIPQSSADQEVDLSQFKIQADDQVVVARIPDGADWREDKPIQLSDQVYMHTASIESKINESFPGVLQGGTPGSSGRQDDRATGYALSIYESPLENVNYLWANALELGFHIAEKMDMLPTKVNKGDIDSYSELTVDLGKEDPIQLSQRTSQGQMLFERNIIDHLTLLTEYMGKTVDEAEKIIDQTWVDNVIRSHPAFPQMVLEAIGEEMGAGDRLAGIEQEMGGQAQGINPSSNIGSQGGEPRTGNIKTSRGREMSDLSVTHEPRRTV